MASTAGAASYWQELASSYMALGWPLRPSREDIRFMEDAVAAWADRHAEARLHALLLGVTPQIAKMRWPAASSLTSVDGSTAMAQTVWPGNVQRKRRMVCGNWLALPLGESSCGVVIGDGSMNCLPYPDGYRQLAAETCRVLHPDGILILRCYIRPDLQEHPDDVFAGIFGEPIPSFHHFKFRLLMAMQSRTRAGIAVSDVYRYWVDRNIDTQLLTSRKGWEKSAIDTIKLYRDSITVHTFPTLAEYRAVLGEFFEEVSMFSPARNLGERCPTLVLRPRPNHTV